MCYFPPPAVVGSKSQKLEGETETVRLLNVKSLPGAALVCVSQEDTVKERERE